MAKYSIQDTSLIAIGDAVREKSGKHTRIEYVYDKPLMEVAKSPNAIDFDSYTNPLPASPGHKAIINIPEAKKIKIKIAWRFLSSAYWVRLTDVNNQRVLKLYEGKISSFDEIEYIEEVFDTNHLSFELMGVLNDLTYSFFYAECYALDEDGNEIYVDSDTPREVIVPNTLTPAQMATEIEELPVVPESAFTLTGSMSDRFKNDGWTWFIKDCGDKVTTSDISEINSTFQNCYSLEEIPFDINMKTSTSGQNSTAFCSSCNSLKKIPNIYNFKTGVMSNMFYRCYRIRTLPESMLDWDMSYTNKNSSSFSGIFQDCHSLRNIPSAFLKKMKNNTTSVYSAPYYSFSGLCSLDELIDLPVNPVKYTSNAFTYFKQFSRVKDVIFETNEDGSPIEVTWKSQTIDLTQSFGHHYDTTAEDILDYNSGIIADKEVKDDATYQALKDDPDWFTCVIAYSRYDHDSAVRTINSLPDVSSGSGNSIKFRGNAGASTDGGAINTLTEEEIAVAAAKGWTVTLI